MTNCRLRACALSALLCWVVTAGEVGRVIDGDTFQVTVKIWPSLTANETVRVLGVNTPELRGATKAASERAKAATTTWLSKGEFKIEACIRDAFGRLLGKVYRGDSVLADELVNGGLGVRFP